MCLTLLQNTVNYAILEKDRIDNYVMELETILKRAMDIKLIFNITLCGTKIQPQQYSMLYQNAYGSAITTGSPDYFGKSKSN